MKRIVIFLIWMSFGVVAWGESFSKEFPNLMSLTPVEKAVALKQVAPNAEDTKDIIEWETEVHMKFQYLDTSELNLQTLLIFSRAEAWAMGYKEGKKQAKK